MKIDHFCYNEQTGIGVNECLVKVKMKGQSVQIKIYLPGSVDRTAKGKFTTISRGYKHELFAKRPSFVAGQPWLRVLNTMWLGKKGKNIAKTNNSACCPSFCLRGVSVCLLSIKNNLETVQQLNNKNNMSRRPIYQKHTQDNKKRLISLVLQAQLSIRNAAEITKIPLSTAKLIIKRYRNSNAKQRESREGIPVANDEKMERTYINSYSSTYPSPIQRSAQPILINTLQPQFTSIPSSQPILLLFCQQPSFPSWNLCFWT